MMKARVKVHVSQWAWGDGDESHVLAGGTHSLEGLSKGFAQALAAAAADPGVIEIASSDDAFKTAVKSAVQSDSESETVLRKAQDDGSWIESNLEAQIASFDGIAAAAKEMGDEGAVIRAEHAKAQAQADLAALRGEN